MPIRLATAWLPVWPSPGGNITGLSTLPRTSGKRLELLKEVVPKLSRVAVLGNPATRVTISSSKETELAARGIRGGKLQSLDVRGPEDIETRSAARKERAEAVCSC